jgi:hypothetical protein
MIFRMDRSPRDRLYWLIDLLLANELSEERFSQEFGHTYVMDIEGGDLTSAERREFEAVFAVTKLFATAEQREFDSYPARKTEADIRLAAQSAKAALRPKLS